MDVRPRRLERRHNALRDAKGKETDRCSFCNPDVGNLAEDAHERCLFMRSNNAGNPLFLLRHDATAGLPREPRADRRERPRVQVEFVEISDVFPLD